MDQVQEFMTERMFKCVMAFFNLIVEHKFTLVLFAVGKVLDPDIFGV